MKDQDMKNQIGKAQANQDNTGKGVGVSGQNPAQKEGPVAGDATNTRGGNSSANASQSNQPKASTLYDPKTDDDRWKD